MYMRSGYGIYPFDSYHGEEVIAYDDVTPKLEELLAMSNSSRLRCRVFGATRYHERYMDANSIRTLIVLSNKTPDECYRNEHGIFDREAAFLSRFIVIHMDAAWFD